jgi:hypothetical protein
VEANTNQSKWFIPCCDNEKCPDCKGAGKIYPDRCPVHYYKGDIKTLRYLYDCYNHKNILPFSGSPIDQPKVLFSHFERINHYVAVFGEMREKSKQENADFSAKIMSGKKDG